MELNVDTLYELLRHVDLETFINICSMNKHIYSQCRSNLLLRKLYIEKKTDLFLEDIDANDPINSASAQGYADIVDELISRGYIPTSKTVMSAYDNKHLNVVFRLLADPLIDPAFDNSFLLSHAGFRGNLPLVAFLLQHPRLSVTLKQLLTAIGFSEVTRETASNEKDITTQTTILNLLDAYVRKTYPKFNLPPLPDRGNVRNLLKSV